MEKVMIKSKQIVNSVYFGRDIFVLFISFLFSLYLFSDREYMGAEWALFLSMFFSWFLLGYWKNLYSDNSVRKGSKVYKYAQTYIMLVGFAFVFFEVFGLLAPNRNVLIAFSLGIPLIGIPLNYLLNRFVEKIAVNQTKHTLIAGIGDSANHAYKQLQSSQLATHNIKGFIKCKEEECQVEQDRIVGDLDAMNQYLMSNKVDEIVIALPIKVSKKVKRVIDAADYHGIRVKYIPDFQGVLGKSYKLCRYGNMDVINVRQVPLDKKSASISKYVFDVLFSFFALLFLMPVFAIIAILIKLDSDGPIFYCPVRIGKGGKPFRLFKFRSMKVCDKAVGGSLSTKAGDERITKLGRILRKYSLDELPQFLNVLLGDMSVVGPRPHRSYLNQQFQSSEEKYMIRHYCKPGITGWAQVNGWRGPTETKEQKSQRTQHDLWYVENWTLSLDFKIVYMTVFDKKTHLSAF
ncbi:exopolysaccharide biosynthesis polyprenyl glycosylphosphotransferase [Pontibacter sp. FD36]|uniref:exopolysaccharide biosynthesis polyprenyl glycosylphosphotransferase n=1 Tax=Pontibacter sp. FD36 TaxID=2789860 RepID=UPI0018A8AE39|nr:exopolysaccharide biosynthesis polyprenyl glycosylphosphotransferase [Pontibacter sp. FD36]MBF8964684.1 exopolysaccharide biosynthesis polyprenyl glycosylphosphotransferase [Pontibacter sp. FD36]